MIRYALICKNGHEFEGWFKNSSAFDKQSKNKLLTCLKCGTNDVSKALMAPNLGQAEVMSAGNAIEKAVAKLPKETIDKIREVRDEVVKNADYVGDKFAEEARKIHYEEADERGIYGEASFNEIKELEDEGIPFQPLPTLPEDQN